MKMNKCIQPRVQSHGYKLVELVILKFINPEPSFTTNKLHVRIFHIPCFSISTVTLVFIYL